MGGGASSRARAGGSLTKAEARSLVPEWSRRHDAAFDTYADPKGGRVRASTAARLWAKAERWTSFQASLPSGARKSGPRVPNDAFIAEAKTPPARRRAAAADDDEPLTSLEAALADEPLTPLEAALAADAGDRGSVEAAHASYVDARSAALRAVDAADADAEAPPAAAEEEVAAADIGCLPGVDALFPAPAPAAAPAGEPRPRPRRRESKLVVLIEDGALDVRTFGSFLNKSFAGESLAFVLRCQEYKALWRPDSRRGASVSDAAAQLAAQFLNECAPDPVSLPPRLVDPVLAAVAAKEYSPSLFDAAMHHVADELSKRNLTNFIRDERHRDREPALLPPSTSGRANPAYEAKLLLDDARRGAAFRGWLDGELAAESYAFYDAVARYRALFNTYGAGIDEAAVLAAATAIAEKYLGDGPDATPINAAAAARRRATAVLAAVPVDAERLHVSLFDELRVGVLKLLARDKLPRFRVAERTFDAPPSPTKARRGSFFATTKRPSLASLRPNLAGFRKRRGTVGAV